MAEFDITRPKDVQVQSFAQPTPVSQSTAQAISQLGEVASSAIKTFKAESQKEALSDARTELQESFQQTGDVVSVVEAAKSEGATFDPQTGEILGGVENLSPEVQQQLNVISKEAKGVFSAIASSVAQGATAQSTAALRLESELKRMTNANPGFGPELRAWARNIAGYDPSNFQLRQILNINRPNKAAAKKTAFDKMNEEASAIVGGFAAGGVTLDHNAVLFTLTQDKQAQFKANLLDNQLKINEFSASKWLADRRAVSNGQTTRMLANIAKAKTEGGILDTPAYMNLIKEAKQETKNEFFQAFQKSGKLLDMKSQQEIVDGINADFAEVEKAVAENGFGKLLDEKLNTIVRIDKMWGTTQNRRLARLSNAHGERIASQLIEVMASAGSPGQLQLLIEFIPALKAHVGTNNISAQESAAKNMDVINKLISGDPNLTAEDLLYRPAAESIIYGDTMPKDAREAAVIAMGTTEPVRTTAWLSKSDQRRKASDKEVKFMVQQFQINGDKLVKGIAKDIATNTGFKIKLEDDGKISATIAKSRKGVEQNLPTTTNAIRQLQIYIDAARNGWSNDLGVSATFAKDTVEEINRQAVKISEGDRSARQPATISEPSAQDIQTQIESLQEQLRALQEK